MIGGHFPAFRSGVGVCLRPFVEIVYLRKPRSGGRPGDITVTLFDDYSDLSTQLPKTPSMQPYGVLVQTGSMSVFVMRWHILESMIILVICQLKWVLALTILGYIGS